MRLQRPAQSRAAMALGALCALLVAALPAALPLGAQTTSPPAALVAVNPARLLDTRPHAVTIDGVAGQGVPWAPARCTTSK